MKNHRIAFIGAGNMARSLIGGLIADGVDPALLQVTDSNPEACERLQARFGVTTHDTNADAARAAEIVVLAVKPPQVPAVAREIAPVLAGSNRLVISIAAGLRMTDLADWLGADTAIVRAMPNTPALVQSGATALCANARAGEDGREAAETILRAVGLALWIEDETLMDAVTALSGSGPAYFFLVMEAMEAAGRKLGLPEDITRVLTVQTAFGAAKMALESTDASPAELRAQVTSPGGTTERALAVLQQGGLQALFDEALAAGRARSIELSKSPGGKE